MRVSADELTSAEGHLNDPVAINLVRCVKVGYAAQRIWLPGVDDFAAVSGPRAAALRIGRQIDRFRIAVVQLKVFSVDYSEAQFDVHSVLIGGHYYLLPQRGRL